MIGKLLTATGIMTFGFVGYQLWGTGIEYAQAQDDLGAELETVIGPTAPMSAAETTTIDAAPPPESIGSALARIDVPRIGVDATVVEGVGREELKQGPGHYPRTVLPGQLGNAAIAGHRTTYGAPFQELDELETGDEIIVTTAQGRFVYRATGTEIVSPSYNQVLLTNDPSVARLTLTTCHPEYSADYRLIVFAELDVDASAAATPYVAPGAADPSVDAAPEAVPPSDALTLGWFSDEAAFAQVALWGTLLAVIGIGAWLVSRAVRRNLVGFLVGVVPFLVAAYFFFQNVNRLLPPAL